MTPDERKVYDSIRSPHLKYWIPVVWFSNLASKARQEGRVQDSIDLQNLLNVTVSILRQSLKGWTCSGRDRAADLCVTVQEVTGAAQPLAHENQKHAIFQSESGPGSLIQLLSPLSLALSLSQELNHFRTWCATLFGYDWVGVPLVYTQVCLPQKQMLL